MLSQDVAEWLMALRLNDISELAIERAKNSILDLLGVTLPGLDEPATQIAAQLAAADGAAAVASQIGTRFRTSMEWAAFVNGIAGHALDYDDVSYAVIGHPSVVVLPAVLAVAEATGASGADALVAFIGGVEVMAKAARALGERHYLAGWHMTATTGCIASAAAAAKLLGLERPKVQAALGIAASSAAGLRLNFGTMTKPYHAGHACRSGVNAARLAAAGFTAEPHVFDGPQGFLAAYGSDPANWSRVSPSLGRPFELESPGLGIKRYPCCYGTHRAIDGMLSLVEEHGLSPADVVRVEVGAPPGELEPLIHPQPRSGLEGKFSMPYALAAALLDGGIGLASFEDGMVRRADVQDLIARTVVRAFAPDSAEASEGLGGGDGHVCVSVHLRDGRLLQQQVRFARGAPENPVSTAEVVAKFRDCASGRLSHEQVDRVIECVGGLANAEKLGPLFDALGG